MVLISSCDFSPKFVFEKLWLVAYDWCPNALSDVGEDDTRLEELSSTDRPGPSKPRLTGSIYSDSFCRTPCASPNSYGEFTKAYGIPVSPKADVWWYLSHRGNALVIGNSHGIGNSINGEPNQFCGWEGSEGTSGRQLKQVVDGSKEADQPFGGHWQATPRRAKRRSLVGNNHPRTENSPG